MRKILLLLSLFSVVGVSAQYDENPPPSFSHHFESAPGNVNFEGFDYDELEAEAKYFEEEEGRTMNGKIRFQDFNFFNKASVEVTADGTEIWRLHFHADGAQAVNVYFNNFHLPQGSGLWIYNEDGTFFDGPHSTEENNDHGQFMTNTVFGEDLVMEYVQPVNVVGEARLNVMGLGYIFRMAIDPLEIARGGGSDPCEVNVNCPEGDEWQCQRDSVVRLQITDGGNQFLCTGSLVNTTAKDCRQYMLTALHCVEGISASDFNFLQCKFNYERANCDGGPFSSSRNRTGAILLADSNDGGGNSGSDFALFEIEDEINDAWNPFFGGWDASGTGATSGVGIHHPAGDLKKISTFSSSLQSVFYGGPGSHWRVIWVATETNHGVTEGGSSGSPIYNSNKQVVGTLTGGSSYCDTPSAPDFYGKMSYHWTNNPNSANEKLKVWLDPTNSGVNSLWGAYRPCQAPSLCGTVAVEESAIEDNGIAMMPNPTTGEFFVRAEQGVDVISIRVYDANGRLVAQEAMNGPVKQMNIADLEAGSYLVVFDTKLGNSMVQKLVKY